MARVATAAPKQNKKTVLSETDDGRAVPMTPDQIRKQEERDRKRLDVARMRMSPLFEKYNGKLTQAQMLFAHYVIINGASYEDAIALAYPRSQTWTPLARRKRAYNLLSPTKSPTFVAYFNELRAELLARLEEEQIWTKGMATQELKSALDDAKADQASEGVTKENAALRLGAIQELNRVHGLHKMDVTLGTNQVVFQGEGELSDDLGAGAPKPDAIDEADFIGIGDGGGQDGVGQDGGLPPDEGE